MLNIRIPPLLITIDYEHLALQASKPSPPTQGLDFASIELALHKLQHEGTTSGYIAFVSNAKCQIIVKTFGVLTITGNVHLVDACSYTLLFSGFVQDRSKSE